MIKTLILLLLTFSTGFAQQSTIDAAEQMGIEKSRELIDQRKYTEVSSLLTKLITKNPDSFNAYLLRSKAKYGLKDYMGAIDDSKSVLANSAITGSVSLLAKLNVGISYNNLGEYQQAISFLRAARTLDSTNTTIYFSLAYSYLGLSQLDSSYTELTNLLKFDPTDKRGHYGKGKIHLMKKQYQQAIVEFDNAIALDSRYAMAYQNRGEAKRMLSDFTGCCQDWRRCVEVGMVSIKPYLQEVCP